MQYPQNLDIRLNLRLPTRNTRNTQSVSLDVNESIAALNRMTIPQIKQHLTAGGEGGYRGLSSIAKFPVILMYILNITDARETKVFRRLPQICEDPYKVIELLNFLYDLYRNIIGNGNLPPIDGYNPAPVDRDAQVAIQTAAQEQGAVLDNELYAYTTVFYLHWARLNGSWPSNRHYAERLARIDSLIMRPERTPPVIPPVPPVIRRTASITTRSVAKEPSPHLVDSFFKYYDMAVKNNSCKTEDCTICLEPMNVSDGVGRLKLNECGHFFHKECLAGWTKPECPICRTPTPRGPRPPRAAVPARTQSFARMIPPAPARPLRYMLDSD